MRRDYYGPDKSNTDDFVKLIDEKSELQYSALRIFTPDNLYSH